MGRRMQTVAAVTCMKMLLMVFNVVFWVTGVILLAFGLWMKISLHQFLELSSDYNSAVPYIFIGTGSVIILVGFFACSCTAKGQPVLLYMLAIFLGVIFILELCAGVAGYIYRHKLEEGFRTGLYSSIQNYGNKDIFDKDVDLLQSSLKCCGVENYKDWFNVWKNESVPLSCCQDKHDCHHAPVVNETEIYTLGCYGNLVDFVNHNLGAIGGGAVGLACIQLLGILLSCCLAKNVNKAKYEPMG